MRKNAKLTKTETNPDDFRISSFQTCDGEAAVEMVWPGAFESRMSPSAALNLAARLAAAAVAGSVYGVEGESVSGPRDGEMLAGVLGPAVALLLGRQLSEQTPETA